MLHDWLGGYANSGIVLMLVLHKVNTSLDKTMANTKLILGFIAGVSVGAIAGILIAPDKGAATRKKVIDKSTDLKDVVKENILSFLDKLEKGTVSETGEQVNPSTENF